MLEKIKGVSEVEVMVNLDATNSKGYEKNLIKGQQTTDESDEHGGIRKVEDQTEETQVVFVREGDREIPLLVQTKKPDVRGVFVVAKGVDHATVKMWVIESVAKVLDVPRSEEHTSELQSRGQLVCRLLLEKKKNTKRTVGTGKRADVVTM